MLLPSPNIDFIGDIHGHLDHLEALLQQMAYVQQGGAYRHPERMVVFLGDYIDRGPNSPGVVRLVRNMVDAGSAVALCGNHEFNAVCFNLELADGQYLRPHIPKNIRQHRATLEQYSGQPEQYASDIAWFKTLPLYLDMPGFRAVHATWDQEAIQLLQAALPDARVPYPLLQARADQETAMQAAIERTCKGVELALPEGFHFFDKDGHQRQEIRVKWWQDPAALRSFQDLSVIPDLGLDHLPYQNQGFDFYASDAPPVFFGHYWMTGTPNLASTNACCLDFSVAKEGVLTAYRFDGERKLSADKLVWL